MESKFNVPTLSVHPMLNKAMRKNIQKVASESAWKRSMKNGFHVFVNEQRKSGEGWNITSCLRASLISVFFFSFFFFAFPFKFMFWCLQAENMHSHDVTQWTNQIKKAKAKQILKKRKNFVGARAMKSGVRKLG